MTSIVNGLFGGESGAEEILQRFRPAGFDAPGMTGRFANNRFTLTRTPAAQAALADVKSGFLGKAGAQRDRANALLARIPGLENLRGELGGLRPGITGLRGDIRGLRGQVRPGFGRLTRERVGAVRGLGRQAVGNVREELAKRRVAGSSFAASQVAGVRADFAREEDRVRAESFLQEMDATNQLIGQELGLFDTEAGIVGQQFAMALQEGNLADLAGQSFTDAWNSVIEGAQTEVNQLNLETGLAAGLSAIASELMNDNLTAQAEARAALEVGAMNFLGDVAGAVGMVAAASDARLKTNVRKIGRVNGFNIYEWDWNAEGHRIAANEPTIGVLAHEVQEVRPDAVIERDDGYLAVDYGRLF